MNKRRAVKILERHIDKIDKDRSRANSSWVIQTNTYMDKFFGKDSLQSKNMRDFRFNNKFDPDTITTAKTFLEDCITTIKDVGIYKEPNSNLIHKIPDWAIPLILTLAFSAGLASANIRGMKILHDSPKQSSSTKEKTDY